MLLHDRETQVQNFRSHNCLISITMFHQIDHIFCTIIGFSLKKMAGTCQLRFKRWVVYPTTIVFSFGKLYSGIWKWSRMLEIRIVILKLRQIWCDVMQESAYNKSLKPRKIPFWMSEWINIILRQPYPKTKYHNNEIIIITDYTPWKN